MVTLSLSEKEVALLKKSINHCLETCKNGPTEECPDCTELKNVLTKLP